MFLRVCSARIVPTTSRHATHPATCPRALAALTAPSAPTGTRGRAARRAPFPIATTTPLLQPAKSAATWSTMLSSSSPCFWSSSSFSLCCALPASASRACSPGSQAGWHSFWPQCNTLGFRPSGSPHFEPLHIPLRTTQKTPSNWFATACIGSNYFYPLAKCGWCARASTACMPHRDSNRERGGSASLLYSRA